MPKMKSRRSIAKRFRMTSGGKVRHSRAGRSHLLTGKSRNRKRKLRRPDFVNRAEGKRIKILLPYGS